MLKKVFAPHLGREVAFGRRPRRAGVPVLHLRDFLDHAALPPIPVSCDWSGPAVTALRDVDGNDAYGDCVFAELYHFIATATGNATGAAFRATRDQVLADYSKATGFNPADPSTDQGADIPTILNWYRTNPFADGSTLSGFAAVNAADWEGVKAAIYLFENVDFGVGLPDAWINPFPSGDGFVWDAVPGGPDQNNGHSFFGYGYDAAGNVLVDTWGLFGKVTRAAAAAYAVASGGGELYVALTPDLIAKGKSKAPSGVAWDELVATLDGWGGNAPAPAPQPPAPPPAPSGPSLADVQAWAAFGLEKLWQPGQSLSKAERAAVAGIAANWPE